MKAIVYTRISRDAEGEALGVERQRQDCMARAEREGWEVVDVLVENDVGASAHSKKPRPLYAKMMERAKRGGIDVIMAYSNSRLTRRPLELEDLIKLHERTGVRFCTIVSGDDDLGTADGRMVARIKASVDAAEAERISERTRRAKLQRAQQGMPMTGGVRPFGYEADRLTIKDNEAEAIRNAAGRILRGESLVNIVAEWNRTGKPATVRRTLWTTRTLRGILRSPRIAALSEHKGKIVGEAIWPAILERNDWEKLRSVISAPGHGKHEKRLLSGLLWCTCGAKMSPTGRRGMYRCSPVPGSGGCNSVARTYSPLENYVVTEWVKHMIELTGSETWTYEHAFTDKQGTVALTAQRDEITRRIKTVRERYASGKLDDDDFFPLIDDLRARLDGIDKDIATSGRPPVVTPALLQRATTANVLPEIGTPITGIDVTASWHAVFDLVGSNETNEQRQIAAQRAYLGRFIDQIVVGPISKPGSRRFDASTVTILWRSGA